MRMPAGLYCSVGRKPSSLLSKAAQLAVYLHGQRPSGMLPTFGEALAVENDHADASQAVCDHDNSLVKMPQDLSLLC